jgi:hypothetical protein
MSVQLVDDAIPLIRAERLGGNTLRIVCPYCRTRRGRRNFHYHGDGGVPGPWHRLAHCADCDLPKHLRERARDLSYELVEASEPRVIRSPPLVPRKPVLRVVAG